jgi:hypothetical protein
MCFQHIDIKAILEENASKVAQTTDDPTSDHLLPNELNGT